MRDTGTRNIAQRIAMGVICLVVVFYTVYHMIGLFSPPLTTIVVGSTTETSSVSFDGYIFRDEAVVTASYSGAVEYAVPNGTRVAIGKPLATVYSEGSHLSVKYRLEYLDDRIALLEQSVNGSHSYGELETVREDVAATHTDIAAMLASGQLQSLSVQVSDMLVGLGKESMITDKESPLPATLNALYEERNGTAAAGGSSAEILNKTPGYFYTSVDGYESLFTAEAAQSLTPEAYEELLAQKPETEYGGKAPIGKLAPTSDWYFVCAVSHLSASYFEEGQTYDTEFTSSNGLHMPLTLERMQEDGSDVLLIFSGDRTPEGFDFARSQSVRILTESQSGIHVPKSATHKRRGILYVYILRGSVVQERRIEVVYEGEDYYLVQDGVGSEENGLYLKSNDQLILSGTNLFDGRIME